MQRVTHVLALAATAAVAGFAIADEDHDHGLARLGTVEFELGCAQAVQGGFNRAMALYHSFAWSEAAAAFSEVAETDPTCGMAHWGRAMVQLNNPFAWPTSIPPERLDAAAQALDEARLAGLHSAREEGYVAAVEAFVGDRETLDHRTRAELFEQMLGRLAADHPDDLEASVLHALVISANFDPGDRTYAHQMRAAKILEPLFQSHPDHPGVAHYLIHTYDYPALARQGLEAALRYADIAPDAPHALHMPSHIFTRVGYWKESIASNEASAEADRYATVNTHHAHDYMVYAHLQLAQDVAAREALARALAATVVDHFGTAFAYAAMPARIALELDDWEGAAQVALHLADGYPWEKYPQAEAINAFARGIGAARSGDAAAAQAQQARLEALRDATGPAYWVEQVDIQAAVVGALALCAAEQPEPCIAALREAAAREDATEKHVVTPGPILPARELLADTLLEYGHAGEALREYEIVLAKEPNRYRGIAGAMEAARQVGEREKARAHAAHLLEQAAESDGRRPSLDVARELSAG